MMKHFAIVVVLMLSVCMPAQADEARAVAAKPAPAGGAPDCPMHDDTTVNVSFNNNNEKDISVVKALVDRKTAEVQAIAKEAGVTSLDLQSMNYSINANGNNSGGCSASEDSAAPANMNYQVYGNLNFKIQPADKGTAFLEMLVKKGFNANLNVNTYKQCQ
jgi:uncharacterized protein YggE